MNFDSVIPTRARVDLDYPLWDVVRKMLKLYEFLPISRKFITK